MKKQRTPALPPAVSGRMAKRVFIKITALRGESPHDRFIKAVRAGKSPDPDDLRIVAEQLESVISGEVTFERAFNLIQGQGRRASADIQHRNQRIAAEMEELRKEDDYTLDDAAELLAQRYPGVSVESVIKIHKNRMKQQRDSAKLRKDIEERGKK